MRTASTLFFMKTHKSLYHKRRFKSLIKTLLYKVTIYRLLSTLKMICGVSEEWCCNNKNVAIMNSVLVILWLNINFMELMIKIKQRSYFLNLFFKAKRTFFTNEILYTIWCIRQIKRGQFWLKYSRVPRTFSQLST